MGNAVAKQEVQTPAVPEIDPMLVMIERASRDPAVDVGKMRELMAMRKEIVEEESKQAFDQAMNEAQGEMRPIAADASNPQTKSKYASYLALDKALRPIYTKHGFSLNFNTADGAPADHVMVVCDVSRKGHTRRYQVPMPCDGKGAKGGDVMTKTHATGSAMTYGQRYLLKMIFNIAIGNDDDGNAAGAGEKIMEDQAVTLRKMIKDAAADEAKLCKLLKIERLEDLPVSRWQSAINVLEFKKSAQQ